VTTGFTVAGIVGLLVCCAGTLLVAAGVLTSAGVLLDNLLVIALGAGVLGWVITRAVRTIRARDRSSEDHERTGACRSCRPRSRTGRGARDGHPL
jgi:hypothetical protein